MINVYMKNIYYDCRLYCSLEFSANQSVLNVFYTIKNYLSHVVV